MKYPKSLSAASVLVHIIITFFIFTTAAYAQSKPGKAPAKKAAVKPSKTAKARKPATDNFLVAIDTAGINIDKPTVVIGTDQFTDVVLKFIVAGAAPQSNVSKTLTIDDHTTTAAPQFYDGTTASKTATIKISKTAFKGIGEKDTVKILLRINYKKVVAEKGVAYVNISGQDGTSTPISFKSLTKPNRMVSLLDSTTSIQLDTFKINAANQYPVKLYFKLNKAQGTDTGVKINVTGLNGVQNVKLSDDNARPQYAIKIASADWNSKKDTIVNKTIGLYIQQLSPVADEEDLVLKVDNGSADRHLVKLLPPKLKNKVKIFTPISMDNIELVSGKVGVSHYYSSTADPVNSIDSINIAVRLFGNYMSDKNQFAFGFLDTNVMKHFQIMENPITITEREWKNANPDNDYIKNLPKEFSEKVVILNIPLHIKTINLNDSLNNAQYIDVIIQGKTQSQGGSQKIKLSIKDKPFWAEIGTNFDLLDKIQTNNFYAGVYMFDKDIARIGGKKDEKNLSFTGGVYESQSVSAKSTSSAGYAYRDLTSVHRDTGSVSANTSVKSIGILFSPHLKLTNGRTDENGLHVFFSFYTELLWQTVSSNFSYPKTPMDSIMATANLPKGMDISQFPYKENSFSFDFRSHYQGFGLPVYIKEREFNLYINDVFGLSTQGFYVNNNNQNNVTKLPDPLMRNYITDLTFLTPNKKWNPFFLFQFRLNEVKYGITFSGEIRELLIQNAKPVVTLALSKKFDLYEVLKPLVGKFN